jgi:hypothetical protein
LLPEAALSEGGSPTAAPEREAVVLSIEPLEGATSVRLRRGLRRVMAPIRALMNLRRRANGLIGFFSASQRQDELGYRLCHERAHRIRQLLLFVNQSAAVSIRGT